MRHRSAHRPTPPRPRSRTHRGHVRRRGPTDRRGVRSPRAAPGPPTTPTRGLGRCTARAPPAASPAPSRASPPRLDPSQAGPRGPNLAEGECAFVRDALHEGIGQGPDRGRLRPSPTRPTHCEARTDRAPCPPPLQQIAHAAGRTSDPCIERDPREVAEDERSEQAVICGLFERAFEQDVHPRQIVPAHERDRVDGLCSGRAGLELFEDRSR